MYLRRVITASVSGLAFLGLSISAASAQGYSWTGFSVYGGVGGAQLDGDVNVNDTTRYGFDIDCRRTTLGPPTALVCIDIPLLSVINTNQVSSAINGDPGVFGTVGVAGDVEVTPGIVIGAFADIDFADVDASFSGVSSSTIISLNPLFSLDSTTSVNGSMDVDFTYTFGARIGVLTLNRQALLYVLGGYTRLELDGAAATVQNAVDLSILGGLINTGFSGDPISVNLPDSFDGFTVGLGTQVKVAQGFSIKLEGRYSGFESKSVSYSGRSRDVDVDITRVGCSGRCQRRITKLTGSSGTIDVDPEIWSGRLLFSLDF